MLFVFILSDTAIGAEELDFSRYPDERVQKSFIKIYLEEGAKLRGKCTMPSYTQYVLSPPAY